MSAGWTLKRLYKELSSAKAADRMLDLHIKWLVGEFREWKNLGGGWRQHKVTGTRERFDHHSTPEYTASIDVALTLLPDGYQYNLIGGGKKDPYAALQTIEDGFDLNDAQCATAPLAICCMCVGHAMSLEPAAEMPA